MLKQVTFQVVLPENRKIAGDIATAFDEVFNGCDTPQKPAVINGHSGPKISIEKTGNIILVSAALPNKTKSWQAKKFFEKHLKEHGIPIRPKSLIAYGGPQ